MRHNGLHKNEVMARAVGRWRGILTSLGVDPAVLSGRHCGCPLCGDGKDRFRFDDKEGRGTYYCSVCGPGDGLSFVMQWSGVTFPEALKMVNEQAGGATYQAPAPSQDNAKIRRTLQQILSQSRRVQQGDEVWKYLRSRGINLMPNVLMHEALAYWDKDDNGKPVKTGHFPAMIGVVQSPEGRPVALHRTYLQGGAKAPVNEPKKLTPMAGESKGCAIRLFEMGEDGVLGVAEGIETACAATILHGIPTWSTISANMMLEFVPPEGCKELHIFADNDEGYAGQACAYGLAFKLRRSKWQGRVLVHLPAIEEGDFADLLPKPRAASRAPRRDAGDA